MNEGNRRAIVFIISLISALGIGYIYCFSILSAPFYQAFTWKSYEITLAFSLALVCFSIGTLFCGYLLKKLSFPTLLMMSATLYMLGFIIIAWMNHIYYLYLGFSLFGGFGFGIAYHCIITFNHQMNYIHQNRNEGVLLCAFALSGSICGILIKSIYYILPWRQVMILIAMITFILLSLNALVFHYIKLPIKKHKEVNRDHGDMLRSRSFFLAIIWTISIGSFAMGNLAHVNTYMIMFNGSSEVSYYLLLILPFCNACGRFIYSLAGDHIKLKSCIITVTLIFLLSLFLLMFSILMNQLLFYICSTILSLFIFGFVTALLPRFIDYLYGSVNFSIHYAIYNLQSIPVSFLGPFILLWLSKNRLLSTLILMIIIIIFKQIGKSLKRYI